MKFNNRNIIISDNCEVHPSAKIGDGTIIYDNVVIEEGVIISNNCVIGEPLAHYYTDDNYDQPKTIIGAAALVRSHSIIYAGVTIGNHFTTGHHAIIREGTVIGDHCSIGTFNEIQGTCKIGDYCRFQSNVSIGQFSQIGDFVFIYPFTVLTNDLTPPSDIYCGPRIGDYSQIASSSILLANAVIGKHSLVGANSTVGGKFEDDSFIYGSPARRKGVLSKMPFFNKEGRRHYPWPTNYDKGMPWTKSDTK